MNKNFGPAELERYSFLWSEARLVIAAVALLLGGVPVLRVLLPVPALFGFVGLILTLTWIISGLASLYLLYRWMNSGRKLFGRSEPKDTYAFWVAIVSGINLGLTGLLGTNIGMTITMNRLVFMLVAVVYLISAWYLYGRWKKAGEKVF